MSKKEKDIKVTNVDSNGTAAISTNKEKEQKKKKASSGKGGKIASHVILIIFVLIVLLPFLFAIAASFADKTMLTGWTEMIRDPETNKLIDVVVRDFNWYMVFNPTYWTTDYASSATIPVFSFANYEHVLNMTFESGVLMGKSKLIFGFLNTLLDSVPMVVIGTMSSAMCAYAVSRINFKGRNAIFSVFLSSMMIPGVLTMVPAYVMFVNIYHWGGTPLPIILPGMFGGAMTMFFIKQFYMTFPKELEEAAMIDGLNRWGIFWKVAFPLAKPVIMTQIILSFNGAYNDYLNPLIYVGQISHFKTLQLHLAELSSDMNPQPTLALAGAIITLIPTFVLYMCAQKVFVDGIVMSGIKG